MGLIPLYPTADGLLSLSQVFPLSAADACAETPPPSARIPAAAAAHFLRAHAGIHTHPHRVIIFLLPACLIASTLKPVLPVATPLRASLFLIFCFSSSNCLSRASKDTLLWSTRLWDTAQNKHPQYNRSCEVFGTMWQAMFE